MFMQNKKSIKIYHVKYNFSSEKRQFVRKNN